VKVLQGAGVGIVQLLDSEAVQSKGLLHCGHFAEKDGAGATFLSVSGNLSLYDIHVTGRDTLLAEGCFVRLGKKRTDGESSLLIPVVHLGFTHELTGATGVKDSLLIICEAEQCRCRDGLLGLGEVGHEGYNENGEDLLSHDYYPKSCNQDSMC